MSQAEVDELDDDTWAMYWNDLIWVRNQEKEKSLAGLRKFGM
ncbi:MAG: hypothetical protein Q8O72_10645 [Bacteroidales bacterium]|nr:hypothetical protein [Bacteroidales bacterium]